jgi:uncharacterized membrane protein
MKYHEFGAENDRRYGEQGNPLPPPEDSEKRDSSAIRTIKLVCLLLVFGLIMGGVLIILIFAMWAILAIGFGVISGVSFTSPLCWVVGGIFSGLIIYVELVHKNK